MTDTGEPGFDVYVEHDRLGVFKDALAAAGVVEAGADTADVLRVEAGVPAFHRDMDEETIPLEAAIESRAISLTKGCYVGQEVIIRVLHRGHGRVAKKLVGLTIEGEAVPADGAIVRSGEKEIGEVTSSVRSIALDRPIALAYLQRDFLEPGTAVSIDGAHRCSLCLCLSFRLNALLPDRDKPRCDDRARSGPHCGHGRALRPEAERQPQAAEPDRARAERGTPCASLNRQQSSSRRRTWRPWRRLMVYLSAESCVDDGNVAFAPVRNVNQLLRRIPAQRVHAPVPFRDRRHDLPCARVNDDRGFVAARGKMRFDFLSYAMPVQALRTVRERLHDAVAFHVFTSTT